MNALTLVQRENFANSYLYRAPFYNEAEFYNVVDVLVAHISCSLRKRINFHLLPN